MLVREGHAQTANGVSSLQPNAAGQQASVTATYLIGARGPEYRRDDTAQETDSQGRTVTKASWYVYDGLGSVVGEVDPVGNLTSSPKYDVYGAVRANGGSATSRQGFVGSLGHVTDTETGLVYMRARYYDPAMGRFVSEDDSREGMNWYIYAGNNPISLSDMTGHGTIYMGFADSCLLLGAALTALALFAMTMKKFGHVSGSVAAAVFATAAAGVLGLSLVAADASQAQSWGPAIVACLAGFASVIDLMITNASEAMRSDSLAIVAIMAVTVEGMMVVGALAAQDAEAERSG